MKQNDIVLVAVCVFIGGIISFVVSNAMFKTSGANTQVEVVEKITSEFALPSDKYFNGQSKNPTQQIQIGNGTDQVQFAQ